MTYVLDTNIITAILKGNEKVKQRVEEVIKHGEEVFINCISYYEIKRGLLAAKAESQLERFRSFCEELGLLLLDRQQVFDEAAAIYSTLKIRGQIIGDADILIAALAKTGDLVLVTDDGDFQRVENLTVENWLA
ncbi:MAG: type II toxin-antitoxin system VapC family toxin [Candidatus Brocadiales bacterium]|nr:type II toxin-antitoxin system VapC family toxin [Candidatus Brocadiales bacterium]